MFVYQEYSKLSANCPPNADATCVTTIPMERAWAAALVLIVIVLLLIIIIRCVMVGIRSGSNMGSLVCFGVAAFLTFQTFENIGMCIGITPVIGITLPFFSYGGSSLFTTFAALGMVSGIHFRPRPKRNSIYY